MLKKVQILFILVLAVVSCSREDDPVYRVVNAQNAAFTTNDGLSWHLISAGDEPTESVLKTTEDGFLLLSTPLSDLLFLYPDTELHLTSMENGTKIQLCGGKIFISSSNSSLFFPTVGGQTLFLQNADFLIERKQDQKTVLTSIRGTLSFVPEVGLSEADEAAAEILSNLLLVELVAGQKVTLFDATVDLYRDWITSRLKINGFTNGGKSPQSAAEIWKVEESFWQSQSWYGAIRIDEAEEKIDLFAEISNLSFDDGVFEAVFPVAAQSVISNRLSRIFGPLLCSAESNSGAFSDEVHSILFCFEPPIAHEKQVVFLTGDFVENEDGEMALQKSGFEFFKRSDEKFYLSLKMLSGRYLFTLSVDGQIADDLREYEGYLFPKPDAYVEYGGKIVGELLLSSTEEE